MMWSILIPTLPKRRAFLNVLLAELERQIKGERKSFIAGPLIRHTYGTIEILIDGDSVLRIGSKRNRLLKSANGKYVCFIDDDDMISPDYVETIIEGVKSGADCVSLKGIMTTNGSNPEVFEHSVRYKEYRTTNNEIKYERYPNHLNTIRADIAKQFLFKDSNWGEDTDWATQIFNAGAIKTEFYTDKVLYYYRFISSK